MEINSSLRIGDYFKEIRKRNRLTQEEFANRIKIPRSTYANYENNNREPTMDIISTISKEFNVDLFSILNLNAQFTMKVNDKGDISISNPHERIKASYSRFLNDCLTIYAIEGNEVGFLSPLDEKILLDLVLSTQLAFIKSIDEILPLQDRLINYYNTLNKTSNSNSSNEPIT